MSALEDLLDEVRAEAKNAALAEYENEISRLRYDVDDLSLELNKMTRSNAAWKEAHDRVAAEFTSVLGALRVIIDEC